MFKRKKVSLSDLRLLLDLNDLYLEDLLSKATKRALEIEGDVEKTRETATKNHRAATQKFNEEMEKAKNLFAHASVEEAMAEQIKKAVSAFHDTKKSS